MGERERVGEGARKEEREVKREGGNGKREEDEKE